MASRTSSSGVLVWKREDVSICKCSEQSYVHVHCPCEDCKGKAVRRNVEHRHWKTATESAKFVANRERTRTEVELAHTNSTSDDLCVIDTTIANSDVNPLPSTIECESRSIQNEQSDQVNASPSIESLSASSSNSKDPRDDVVWSVMEAMQLVEDANASEQKFLEILHFSKNSYRRGLECQTGSINVSDHLDQMQWPDTYRDAMKLIKEFGYQSPKKMYVCLSDRHFWTWDITGEEEVCRHCNERGEIPYYYLSLSDKVYIYMFVYNNYYSNITIIIITLDKTVVFL